MKKKKMFEEKIKGIEFFFDCLEMGKSVEELEVELDIMAAAGVLSESSHEIWRGGLNVIRSARREGADRNEVMTYLRSRAKAEEAK